MTIGHGLTLALLTLALGALLGLELGFWMVAEMGLDPCRLTIFGSCN